MNCPLMTNFAMPLNRRGNSLVFPGKLCSILAKKTTNNFKNQIGNTVEHLNSCKKMKICDKSKDNGINQGTALSKMPILKDTLLK